MGSNRRNCLEDKTYSIEWGKTYHLKKRNELLASGYRKEKDKDYFTFKKGSRGNLKYDALKKATNLRNYCKKRIDLMEKKILIQKGKYVELTKDYSFDTPTQAVSVMLGYSASPAKLIEDKEITSSSSHCEVSQRFPRSIQQVSDDNERDELQREYNERTEAIPPTTEANREKRHRIGQGMLRNKLINIFHCCPLTGISDLKLLRASHIKPWRDCKKDERLDPNNCLLLSVFWDAAFDQGLVTFNEDGSPEFSPQLSLKAERQLLVFSKGHIDLTPERQKYMKWHRCKVYKRCFISVPRILLLIIISPIVLLKKQ